VRYGGSASTVGFPKGTEVKPKTKLWVFTRSIKKFAAKTVGRGEEVQWVTYKGGRGKESSVK